MEGIVSVGKSFAAFRKFFVCDKLFLKIISVCKSRHIPLDIITYALLESAIRPAIQPKSSRSHEAEPSWIWMTGSPARSC